MLHPDDFRLVCDVVRRRAAVVLGPGKEYLVEARLTSLARHEGTPSVAALVGALRSDPEGPLARKVAEAMTTHETSFFRDPKAFESLRDTVLPDLAVRRARERRIDIWCAAASSGQEPYSVAIALEEAAYFDEWEISILATDVSARILRRATEGRYSALEVSRGLTGERRDRWFVPEGDGWRLDDRIRSRVEFRELNLAAPWPALPRQDLIFLRNVLIYFDTPMKGVIVNNVARHLKPGGYLYTGHAESLQGVQHSLRQIAPAIYRNEPGR